MNPLIVPAALILGIAIYGVIEVRKVHRRVAALRARGLYPEEGKEREEDVLSLLKAGEKILAIRCYRTLHKVGLKQSKAAVALIEKGMPHHPQRVTREM